MLTYSNFNHKPNIKCSNITSSNSNKLAYAKESEGFETSASTVIFILTFA